MRILVAGDTHGHASCIEYKAKVAKRLGADRMIIVGDFGMWPGHDGIRFLDDVNAAAREYGINIFALPGNHEDHDQWDKWLNMGMPQDGSKFTYIRSNLLISPKVHNWKWGSKRFFIAGGAVSIDKRWRKQGISWWPNEELSEDETQSIEKYAGPDIDYLFTHDASNHTQWGFNLVPDPESSAHRRRIDRVIKALRPRMQFHGHMHARYEWINTASHGQRQTAFGTDDSEWNGKSTLTYGLQCDGEADSWGILDTQLDRFLWPVAAISRWDPDLSFA